MRTREQERERQTDCRLSEIHSQSVTHTVIGWRDRERERERNREKKGEKWINFCTNRLECREKQIIMG